MAQTLGSLLLSIPGAELHRVTGHQQWLVERGPLTVSAVAQAAPPPAPVAQTAAGAATAGGGKQQQLYPDLYQSAPPAGAASQSGQGCDVIVAAVGTHSWPLLRSTQTLKVGQLTFVFSTPQHDTFLSMTLAADTDVAAVGMLEAILEEVTVYRESAALLANPQAQAGEAVMAEHAYKSSLARGVHKSSKRLATGLLASATYAAAGIGMSARRLTPAEPTTTPVAVSAGTKSRFKQTAQAAAFAAMAMNGAANCVAWAGGKVAGGVLWAAGADKRLEAGQDPSTLREVGHAALAGFTQVWDSMEEAGKTVLLATRDGTADVVRQRYGHEAADVSVDGMNAAGYTADAALAARKIGVRALAKGAAKSTAKGVMHKWAGAEEARPAGSAAASSSSSSYGVGSSSRISSAPPTAPAARLPGPG